MNYEAGHYGPYAPNLNKVLEAQERRTIRGYGDSSKPDRIIELIGDAKALARFARVTALVDGFETSYGMELLSTVYWVAHRRGPKADAPANKPEKPMGGFAS